MLLTLVQLAESFGEEERVIEDWVRSDGLPCIHDRGRMLFDRAEVVAWATQRGLGAGAGFLAPEPVHVDSGRRLEPMLRAGGIWRDVPSARVFEILERVIGKLPGASEPVRRLLVKRMHEPNGMSWAPVGHGIALPHLRTPVALGREAGTFALLFLTDPLATAGHGPDGVPCTRLLFFVAPSPRTHLELIGQLSAALVRGSLRHLVIEGAADADIYSALAEAETSSRGRNR